MAHVATVVDVYILVWMDALKRAVRDLLDHLPLCTEGGCLRLATREVVRFGTLPEDYRCDEHAVDGCSEFDHASALRTVDALMGKEDS